MHVSACKVTRQCFCHRCNHEYIDVCHTFCLFMGHYCSESRQKAIFWQAGWVRIWLVDFVHLNLIRNMVVTLHVWIFQLAVSYILVTSNSLIVIKWNGNYNCLWKPTCTETAVFSIVSADLHVLVINCQGPCHDGVADDNKLYMY